MSDGSTTSASTPRFLPLLVVLFVGSGCAALIYEVVWFQLLSLVIGSNAISMGVLLATFMGGMCAGSLSWPRLVSPAQHPFRVYALLEAGIGVCGILVLLAVPHVGSIYAAVGGQGSLDVTLRAVAAALCLLPPTFMMGATLPVIARWIESTPRGVSWLGFFYGGNTAGAVLGCLLAGLYLLRLHDMPYATYFAVAINFVVAAIAYALAGFAPHRAPESAAGSAATPLPAATKAVFLTIAISGYCALSAEVVWARLLALMLGGTVYTFSIILAVFLTGLGIGSAVGSLMARDNRRPWISLGVCQLLQAASIAWAAYMLADSLPWWPINQGLAQKPTYLLQLDLVRCAWAILPAACLWGASFPLALAAVVGPGHDAGRVVGLTYAANTVGAIAGSLGASLITVPWIGTQHTQQVLMALSLVGALVVFFKGRPAASSGEAWLPGLVTVGALAVVVLIRGVPVLPWQLVAYGRELPYTNYSSTSLYVGEGLNSTVEVTQWSDGVRSFHVAGKTEASTLVSDMRLQRMLGHVPALFHPNPESVLIVGCGAGVTAGSFTQYPTVKRIVICEIEPLVPQKIAPYFKDQNYNVVNDPRVQIIYDDARHYILTTQEKFDIITSDPIHPWVKGAATLYTKEYFELVKQRLKPGGLVTQWVPFYESDEAVVRSEIATFFEAFPEGTIWGNDENGYGYDVVMLGQAGPMKLDVDAIEARLEKPEYAKVKVSLDESALGSATDLMRTYAGRAPELKTWLKGSEINLDRNLRLQYLAGLQLNSQLGKAMYIPLLAQRRWAPDLFVGRPETLVELRTKLGL
jgi:spermidine synthase